MSIYEDHTPYEWLIQAALSEVDPWGDDRADLRAEVNTLAALAPDEDSLGRLRSYLAIHEEMEPLGPGQMRQLIEGA